MPTPSSSEVRRQFVDFFVDRHAHRFVPSSPVVPHGDPTLLFTNAGMNQFKPIFLGEETPAFKRAANSQKCVRAGGKHNDLDDVGRDTYHHTFFEMLGNWSFGDYFKAEAIAWAWELLTNVWGLDPDRLHATYFEGDPAEGLEPDVEAKELWQQYLPDSRIHPGNKKDNFWEMGEVGPCGPCSEIHYDRTPDKTGGRLVNGDSDRVIEIWNLVFIQFNRTTGGLKALPAKHVDTGMGFERICAILQGVDSNYDTDVFRPILDRISKISNLKYQRDLSDPIGVAFRAVADHVRMATFAIADGARPGPNKADSVLRSVIRRASRYGYTTLGQRQPWLHEVVPAVVERMGDAFPEVREREAEIRQVIEQEEADFLKVIDRGLKLYAEAAGRAKSNGGRFSGEDVFELHTTFGFPPDMTLQMARDDGFTPDVADYEKRFKAFQDQSRGEVSAAIAVEFGTLPDTDDRGKYDCFNSKATVLAFVRGDSVDTGGELGEGEEAAVLLDRTCFYAEQGGQVGDTGTIRGPAGEFTVEDTRRSGNRVLHLGRVTTGSLAVGGEVEMHVNARRREVAANHTATHLMNLALRQVLGEHVEQRGSVVDDRRTRFDFSHPKALTPEEITKVERRVNALVRENLPVRAETMPLAEAKELTGVRAVFGEKYPDPVRVVHVTPGDLIDCDGREQSVEFCGGTHAGRTGDIGFFTIVAEESSSKGVRRITAVTGAEAVSHAQQTAADLRSVAAALAVPAEQVADRVAALRQEVKELKKRPAPAAGGGGIDADALLSKAQDGVVVAEVAADADAMRSAIDAMKAMAGTIAALFAAVEGDKVTLVAGVSDDLIKRGLKAGDWVREAAQACGGNGGGRPNLAQAGGRDPAKLPAALDAARAFAAGKIGG